MRPPTPVVTLAVGAVTAAALLIVNSLASGTAGSTATADPPAQVAATPATVTATPSATLSVEPSAAPPVEPAPSASPVASAATAVRTYAARVDGGGPFVAVAVRGSEATAYLCDGRNLEAWLWGTVIGGEFLLRGDPDSPENSLLVGRLANGKVSGAVLHGELRLTFAAAKVTKPSGLYRATQQVRGAKVVAGWVVLPDGSQVGAYTTAGGAPATAPELDTADGVATIDGTEIVAQPADPTQAPASVTR